MTCGIYLLSFPNTPKLYIGQSENIESRFRRHLTEMRTETHSFKLNEAYKKYGEPYLEVLEVCLPDKLNELEAYHINLWDAVADGFNTFGDQTFTRKTLESPSKTCKYSKEQILNVLDLLIEDKVLLFKDISTITGVHTNTIRSISAGITHKWLQNNCPTKYTKLLSIKGTREVGCNSPKSTTTRDQVLEIFYTIINEPNKSYKDIAELVGTSSAIVSFISTGTTHVWLKEEFPEQYIKMLALRGSRSGGTVSSRGIHHPDVVSPEGLVYSIPNIREFGRTHNIPHSSLHGLLTGKCKQARGWTLRV